MDINEQIEWRTSGIAAWSLYKNDVIDSYITTEITPTYTFHDQL